MSDTNGRISDAELRAIADFTKKHNQPGRQVVEIPGPTVNVAASEPPDMTPIALALESAIDRMAGILKTEPAPDIRLAIEPIVQEMQSSIASVMKQVASMMLEQNAIMKRQADMIEKLLNRKVETQPIEVALPERKPRTLAITGPNGESWKVEG